MTPSAHLLTAALIGSATALASAGVVELTASGTIDSVTGFGFADPIGNPGFGEDWSVRIVYDTATSPVSDLGDVANFNAVLEYELILGGQSFDVTPRLESVQRLAASSPFLSDGYFFFGDIIVNDFNDGAAIELQLFNFDPFLTSLTLPDTLDLADVPDARIKIDSIFDGGSTGTGVRGDVVSLTLRSVPAPSGVAAVFAAGLFASRRRR